MKVTFLGAAKTVTGSSFLIETEHSKLLVDCGLFQGGRAKERNAKSISFDSKEIDFVLLTHAHIDHSGLIPKLIKDGFRGEVHATEPTVDLCGIMLPDSGYIHEMEANWKNRKRMRSNKPKVEPLYTAEDAYNSFGHFREQKYEQLVTLTPEIAFKFHDAGHILGSSILELWITEDGKQNKLVFSGDLGKPNQPIIKDPSIVEEADYLFLESTYGTRIHEDETTRSEKLAQVINETMKAEGNLIIPSFAVGRTQDLLYTINKLITEDKLESIPDVYIDSPLAISATEIFRRHPSMYDLKTRKFILDGESPFDSPYVTYTRTAEASKELNERQKGAVIISASGMCEAGRIKHHLKHNLWRSESTVLFVGFQAQGTLGRRILDGEKDVRIFGEEIAVKCRIESLDGFSAHADRDQLIDWVNKFVDKPDKIFLVHGEESVIKEFSKTVYDNTGIETYIPELGETVYVTKTVESIPKDNKTTVKERIKSLLEQWELESSLIQERLLALYDICESEVSEKELQNIEKQMRTLRKKLRQYRNREE
ncbi:MBL fold metallo-hydrolase RNA specificity domain-containing protein [Natranaerobius trueperi]|uniref:MBL fold hydrolase n=1 Tax=Natranaerobius trueperi TaxID=759412 RepID=A0A226C3B9_9FIRM|nr:MBL fold metallo-hydrolase [Natranaerobius trueperi]OWZ84917.1 MBL fold hydrolase [Natranaerobius trueperi]